MRQETERAQPHGARPRRPSPALALGLTLVASVAAAGSYPVVDTGQSSCYGTAAEIACPAAGASLSGQDAQHTGHAPSFTDHGDGTVTDNVTGLMWQQDPGAKQSYGEAIAAADSFRLAGHDDWRVPTIKELYSLIDFRGVDPSGVTSTSTAGLIPFIDTAAFAFSYGDTTAGERLIDSQWVTSTVYSGAVMGGEECFFGVNFADGRIKCYPTRSLGSGYFAIYVRGSSYGDNLFVDHGDGTITDQATGLMWARADSGAGLDWAAALAWVDELNAARHLGYDDWRLPNVKELQSLVDYGRAPDTTGSAAIDPVFSITALTNEAGQADYPAFWSSTTHANGSSEPGGAGAYVAFGRALGYLHGRWMDVHGAGAQRSDPKAGDPADYPNGRGPQGDAIRIYNFARPVRTAESSLAGCFELGAEALTGARVVLKQPAETRLRGETGRDGCFTLAPVVAARRSTLRLSGPVVAAGATELAACFALGGASLAGARLLVTQAGTAGRRSTTDASGCAVLAGLAPGDTFRLKLRVAAL